MPTDRRALVVHYAPARPARDDGDAPAECPAETSLVEHAELTALLNDGWRLDSVSPLGGAGNGRLGFAALVVLRHDAEKTVGGFLG